MARCIGYTYMTRISSRFYLSLGWLKSKNPQRWYLSLFMMMFRTFLVLFRISLAGSNFADKSRRKHAFNIAF